VRPRRDPGSLPLHASAVPSGRRLTAAV
jgi:hypothetical protein